MPDQAIFNCLVILTKIGWSVDWLCEQAIEKAPPLGFIFIHADPVGTQRCFNVKTMLYGRDGR